MSLTATVMPAFYEWAAKGQSYEDLQRRLQRNEATTYKRMVNATDFSYNHKSAAHVIGIERWATQRLRVLLGAPLVMDEYDGYAPSKELSMPELAEEFKRTREETKALLSELQRNGVELTRTVAHNEFGEMSLRAWIFYIENHTGRETAMTIQRRQNRVEVAADSS